MKNPPTLLNYPIKRVKSQETVPLSWQLDALFKVIPEEALLKALKVYYAGRLGYTDKVLWRTYIAMTFLNIPSFASLIRALENNPYLARACGITSPNGIPSKFAYSRYWKECGSC